jgi:hypothetical protein
MTRCANTKHRNKKTGECETFVKKTSKTIKTTKMKNKSSSNKSIKTTRKKSKMNVSLQTYIRTILYQLGHTSMRIGKPSLEFIQAYAYTFIKAICGLMADGSSFEDAINTIWPGKYDGLKKAIPTTIPILKIKKILKMYDCTMSDLDLQYLTYAVEILCGIILQETSNVVRDNSKMTITPRFIQTAVASNSALPQLEY